jgi:hypothetical protein
VNGETVPAGDLICRSHQQRQQDGEADAHPARHAVMREQRSRGQQRQDAEEGVEKPRQPLVEIGGGDADHRCAVRAGPRSTAPRRVSTVGQPIIWGMLV